MLCKNVVGTRVAVMRKWRLVTFEMEEVDRKKWLPGELRICLHCMNSIIQCVRSPNVGLAVVPASQCKRGGRG